MTDVGDEHADRLFQALGALVVEHWGVPDRFALLAQTGVLGRLTPASA